ncbi:MAG: hypothetical protein WKF93_10650 [Acidimicrobiales bacterium]
MGTYGGVIAVPRRARPFAATLFVVGVLLAPAVPASAQEDRPEPTTTLPISDEGGGRSPIVPDPFSGEAPDDNGDRGGAAQVALLGALVVGLGLTAGRVVHVARRADRDRTATVDR